MSYTNEQKAQALEFAKLLAQRQFEQAYELLSAHAKNEVSLDELEEDFNDMCPPEGGPIDPIEIEEGDDCDFIYVSVFQEDIGIVEAVIIDAFVIEGDFSKINQFELGRP